MMTKGMYSSEHGDWATPQEFFDKWNAIYHFDIDVCATADNAKCAEYFTPDQDGLKQEWNGNKTYWMNPPYGREIGAWIRKAYESAQKGATVVCLVPARTDTAWWSYIWNFKTHRPRKWIRQLCFVRGRLYFKRNGARSAAPFPSAVVVFDTDRKV